jgi:hypothetical protein
MKLCARSAPEPAALTGELVKLRVRPIPDLSPPIIDSRTALWHDPAFLDPSPFIQGTLAIDYSVQYDPDQDPEGRDYFGPQRALSRDLPEPETWVRHIAQPWSRSCPGAPGPAGDPLDHTRGLGGRRSTKCSLRPSLGGRQEGARTTGQDL